MNLHDAKAIAIPREPRSPMGIDPRRAGRGIAWGSPMSAIHGKPCDLQAGSEGARFQGIPVQHDFPRGSRAPRFG